MFLSTMQSVIVCEYVVNLSTFEKVITEKQNFYTNCSSNNLANKCFLWSKICIEFEGKKHNIDFPTLKLPTSTKNLLWLTY